MNYIDPEKIDKDFFDNILNRLDEESFYNIFKQIEEAEKRNLELEYENKYLKWINTRYSMCITSLKCKLYKECGYWPYNDNNAFDNANFDFGSAIRYLKKGKKIKRKEWKNRYLKLGANDDITFINETNEEHLGWTPNEEEMLATDWELVKEETKKE